MKIFYNFGNYKTTYFCFSIFKYTIWVFYYYNRFGWFRLFGKGLRFKDVRVHGLIFSERIHESKALTINNWRISYLS